MYIPAEIKRRVKIEKMNEIKTNKKYNLLAKTNEHEKSSFIIPSQMMEKRV